MDVLLGVLYSMVGSSFVDSFVVGFVLDEKVYFLVVFENYRLGGIV